MNKYIIKFGLCAIMALTAASCNHKLEIEPQQSIDASDALDNAQNIESAVIGAYAILGDPALYGADLQLYGDLLAAENYINWQGTFQGYREVARKNMTSINSQASRTWTEAYDAINTVNNVLESLSVVEDEDLKAQLEGEARFIRGVVYFELVRLYALPYEGGAANSQLGVPIILTATKNEQQASTKVPRSTVAEVYQQVIDDLTKAAQLLPEENGTRADVYSATAFLARVYLQQDDYVNALDAANTVIESDYFRLNPSVTSAFRNRNTSESIFEIQQNDQNNAGDSNDGLTTFYASMPGIGRGDVQILTTYQPIPPVTDEDPEINLNKTIYDLYEETDARRNELVYVGTGRRAGRLRSGKWTDFGANIPIVRLAEMYLIRAEANLRLGTQVGATPLEDINRIRRRAGATSLVAVTLEDVLLERQLELAFEGHRIHDLRRTGQSTGTFAYNSPNLVFPIPQREIDVNELLVQNPGY